jgi:hypothetical protein
MQPNDLSAELMKLMTLPLDLLAKQIPSLPNDTMQSLVVIICVIFPLWAFSLQIVSPLKSLKHSYLLCASNLSVTLSE